MEPEEGFEAVNGQSDPVVDTKPRPRRACGSQGQPRSHRHGAEHDVGETSGRLGRGKNRFWFGCEEMIQRPQSQSRDLNTRPEDPFKPPAGATQVASGR